MLGRSVSLRGFISGDLGREEENGGFSFQVRSSSEMVNVRLMRDRRLYSG
jgi:hypothetical protein